MRILLLGNAGAGKSSMARRLAGSEIPVLSLDEIAFASGIERRPLPASLESLRRFIRDHDEWVIEGCYGDLIEAASPSGSELRFLNPGVEACVANCRSRPWEPGKFSSPEEQRAALDSLIEWVRRYETREDEYGLARHRAIFDSFRGRKVEYGRDALRAFW